MEYILWWSRSKYVSGKLNFQIDFPDTYLVEFQTKYVWKIRLLGQVRIWKVNFQIDFPDTNLIESQTKYVWKIWLLGQVHIWKVNFFLNRLSSYVLGRISGQVHMENSIFRPSMYLESQFSKRLSRYELSLKVEFSIRTWSEIWPSPYLESRIFKFNFRTKYVVHIENSTFRPSM